MRDVAIVGGGPAGLAAGIALATRGLDVVLFERDALPLDKACGEGVMPAGVRALEQLGVRAKLDANACAAFRGIRYVEAKDTLSLWERAGVRAQINTLSLWERGGVRELEGRFAGPGGLGIRRTALSNALLLRATEVGLDVRGRCAVRRHERTTDCIRLLTDAGETRARMLIAADGLHSPLRRAEGLDGAPGPIRRYGMRRHFQRVPWSDCVEVHFAVGVEAYVTPCGPDQVGVAFLWEHRRAGNEGSFDALMRRFPVLARRCASSEPLSLPRGAGPFWHSARHLVTDRFALLGDAAGYVDALTGEGVSLGLTNALALAELLPDALTRGATRDTLTPYERHAQRAYGRYERLTRLMLAIARRPALRRATLALLRRVPGSFDRLLRSAVE